MKILFKISEDLNVPLEMLQEALMQSRRLVKHIKIPKKDKTYRLVYQPSKKLKIIQYWLDDKIFSNLNIHECATAYRKDVSIKINVKKHQQNRFFLKLDFKNFFPSIKFNDFSPLIKKWNASVPEPFDEDELLHVVNQSCFYTGNLLPIGYPTSPVISNAVMYDFDSKIISYLSDSDTFGSAVYTRYADDLTFSTNMKGACKKIKKIVTKELESMNSPNLELNHSKTRFVSASGGSAFVTGLRVCYDGHLTIHRRYKDKIRLLISLYEKGQLPEEEIASLKGHLSYIKYVDSAFYTKIQKKYFKLLSTIE